MGLSSFSRGPLVRPIRNRSPRPLHGASVPATGPARRAHRAGRRAGEPRQRRSGALRAPHLRCLTVRRGPNHANADPAPPRTASTVFNGETGGRPAPTPIRRPPRTASTVFNGATGGRPAPTPIRRAPRTASTVFNGATGGRTTPTPIRRAPRTASTVFNGETGASAAPHSAGATAWKSSSLPLMAPSGRGGLAPRLFLLPQRVLHGEGGSDSA